jgi:hypothetical protein
LVYKAHNPIEIVELLKVYPCHITYGDCDCCGVNIRVTLITFRDELHSTYTLTECEMNELMAEINGSLIRHVRALKNIQNEKLASYPVDCK